MIERIKADDSYQVKQIIDELAFQASNVVKSKFSMDNKELENSLFDEFTKEFELYFKNREYTQK